MPSTVSGTKPQQKPPPPEAFDTFPVYYVTVGDGKTWVEKEKEKDAKEGWRPVR